MQTAIDLLNRTVGENLTAIRVVKAYVRGDYELEKFEEVNDNLKNQSEKAFKSAVLNMPAMKLAECLGGRVFQREHGQLGVRHPLQPGEGIGKTLGRMLMMIWIGLMLLICAGFSAYAGASQLEQAKQRAKCSLDAFTERRNGVSCICLAILFVILGIGINL